MQPHEVFASMSKKWTPRPLLRTNLQFCSRPMRRVRSDPKCHFGGLDSKLVAIVPDREGLGRQIELHRLFFSGSESDALKPLQCTYRLTRTRSSQSDVELHDFFSRTRTDV